MAGGGLHNLSIALQHILQQFMDSNSSSKNTDMTLPHDGYFQKLSWYFECDKCHYRAFYINEIEAHRLRCALANAEPPNSVRHTTTPSITPRDNEGHVLPPNSIHASTSSFTPRTDEGHMVSPPTHSFMQDNSTPRIVDCYSNFGEIKVELTGQPELTEIASGPQSISQPKKKRKRKQVKQETNIAEKLLRSPPNQGIEEKPPLIAPTNESSHAISTDNGWESYEQIIANTDADAMETFNQSGKIRTRKVVSNQRWSEEETAILNSIHLEPTEMPTKEVMDRLCEALPGRNRCVIRAKASNNKKLLHRAQLSRISDHGRLSPSRPEFAVSHAAVDLSTDGVPYSTASFNHTTEDLSRYNSVT